MIDLIEFKTVYTLALYAMQQSKPADWRIHGIGMAQLYLPNEFRLHVWDRSFLIPNVSLMHTHAWDFTSLVLRGAVHQYRYVTYTPRRMDVFYLYQRVDITPGPNPPEWRNPSGADVSYVWLSQTPQEHFRSGESYRQTANEIHESTPDDGTITLVRRENRTGAKVSIYWKEGGFVSAEPRPGTAAEYERVIRPAMTAMIAGDRA